jgi:CheY-like chemotaxis protein
VAQSLLNSPPVPKALRPVLIVDDDPNDVALIRRMIAKSRILNPIEEVVDGVQAMCYLTQQGRYEDKKLYPSPVMVLLDLKLPDQSGCEVLTWIRSQAQFQSLCVVVLTGIGKIRDVSNAYHMGANSFLTKPVTTEDFLNLVHGISGLSVRTYETGHALTVETKTSLGFR